MTDEITQNQPQAKPTSLLFETHGSKLPKLKRVISEEQYLGTLETLKDLYKPKWVGHEKEKKEEIVLPTLNFFIYYLSHKNTTFLYEIQCRP